MLKEKIVLVNHSIFDPKLAFINENILHKYTSFYVTEFLPILTASRGVSTPPTLRFGSAPASLDARYAVCSLGKNYVKI